MEEQLKDLIHELGSAINDSLSGSGRIAFAINEIKSAGYNVDLVLEASIGLSEDEDHPGDNPGDQEGAHQQRIGRRVGKIKFTISQERDDPTS